MSKSLEDNHSSEFNDCLPCRIWAGAFHIGAAGFVASQWRNQHGRGSQAFILVFSSGKYIEGQFNSRINV